MDKIKYILENKLKNKTEDFLNEVPITDYAYKKAKAYSSLACKIFRKPLECGGYLVTPKNDDDCIVKNIFLSNKQSVESAHYSADVGTDMDAIKEIENKGYKIIGWWHSHAQSPPFHSSDDDDNFKNLYLAVFPHNKKALKREIVQLLDGPLKVNYNKEDDGKKYLIVKGSNSLEDYVEIGVNDLSKLVTLGIKSIRIKKFRGISFAYSLVFNRFDSVAPYAEIAIKYPEKDVIIKKDVKVKEIISNKEILDYHKILEELKTKLINDDELTMHKRKKKLFGGINFRKN